MKPWTVYMVRCKDGTLYTGITVDLPARLQVHSEGKGAKYTRGRGPVKLVWSEEGLSESAARKREGEVKKYSRETKEGMARG
ncbi:TPA: endonuclease [Candidatus Uhrbacteria bacterium]|nr:endonuclease [Candidatus Uhrbacteria bacterium]